MKLNNISVIIFLILITIGSSIPGKNMPALNIFRFDKILHLMEYFILGYLLMNVFRDKTDYPKLLTLFIGFMYGVSDEIYQFTVIGRFPSSFDVFADTLGLTLSIIFFQKLSDNINR